MCSSIPALIMNSSRNFLDMIQDYIFFRPSVTQRDHKYVFSHSCPFEEIFLQPNYSTVSKPVLLHGLYFYTNLLLSTSPMHKPVRSKKGVCLVWHGNCGTLEQWGEMHDLFTLRGYDVLIMDYRTFGKSEGALTEVGLLKDALFVYDYLKTTCKFQDSQIVLHGVSIGTSIATYTAANRPCRFVVLEMPFFNSADLIQKHVTLTNTKFFNRYIKFPFRTDKYILSVKCPVYGIHSLDDPIIPYSSAYRLFEIIKLRRDCLLYTMNNGKHCVSGTPSYQFFINTIYD